MISAYIVSLFPTQTCRTRPLPSALTSWNHVHDDNLASVGLKLVVGVREDAVEHAVVGSLVIVGHIEDEDGAVL